MKKRIIGIFLLIVMLFSIFALASCSLNKHKDDKKEENTVNIFKNGTTDYAIVYSNDLVNHYNYSSKLLSHIRVTWYGEMQRYEYTDKIQDKEILIGATDRQVSIDLVAEVNAANKSGSDFVWGYGYKDGKLAFYANSMEAFDYGWQTFFDTVVHEDGVYWDSDLWVVGVKTYAEHVADLEAEQDRLEAEAEAARKANRERIIAALSELELEYGELLPFDESYGTPAVLPNTSHPRIWVNLDTLPEVVENLTKSENLENYIKVKEIADVALSGDGILPEKVPNFSTSAISKVECLAFMYLVTGDDTYGYAAILHALNFLDTIAFSEESADAYNNSNHGGASFYIMAEVYDWCYDLFTPAQREAFVISACEKLGARIEIGYPPAKQGAVTGHSTSAQILRNWLSFAIATYEEYPQIYNHVMGQILTLYIDAPNWYYPSGANFQGSAYGLNKTFCHMASEMLVYAMSGVKMYDVSFEPTVMTSIYMLRPDGEPIRMGDDYNQRGKIYSTGQLAMLSFFGAAYYDNVTAKAWCKAWTNNFEGIDWSGRMELNPVVFLLLNDPDLEATEEDRFNLSLVNYNGSPTGAIVARSAWNDKDAWLTFTNIDEAYGANHDHKDAGTFQIYYKGILALNSGAYQYYKAQDYGSVYDYTYVKQTISKNGLLIYNPKYAQGNGNWGYSGGQTTQNPNNNENSTFETWMDKTTSHQAKVLGVSYDYYNDGSLKYTYIAGDITMAYDQDTVDSVTRATMSIATGNEAHPLLFIVYDNITSDDASFKKTYLLHTTNEPVFVGDGVTSTKDAEHIGISTVDGSNVFYFTNVGSQTGANGKLTHTTLLPANPTYTVIGGDGYRFWVNGENVGLENPNHNTRDEIGWGRVEISIEGNLNDSFLNVMYVGDADKDDPYVPTTLVQTDTHEGAVAFNNVVMFSKTAAKVNTEITFTADGSGKMNYYVGGLEEGRWIVYVDGEEETCVDVTHDEGLASFKADAGKEITLKPYFARLTFNLNGGIAADGVTLPITYNFYDGYTFPTEVTKRNHDFCGWYADAEFTEPITSIPESATEDITVYAKWEKTSSDIVYELGLGRITQEHQDYYRHDEGYTLPTEVYRARYEFDGWYSDPELTQKIEAIPAGDGGDITIYAKWYPLYGAITYETNLGEFVGKHPKEYKKGEALALPTNVESIGFEFAGWYTDAALTEAITEISTSSTEDITVYAKWRKVFDVVVLNANGGTVEGGNGIKREAGKDIILPTNVTKESGDFLGWYLDPEFTEKIEIVPSDMVGDNGNVTVYAKYLEYETVEYTADISAKGTNIGGKELINYESYIESSSEKALTIQIKTLAIDDPEYKYAQYYMRVRTAGDGANTVIPFYFANGEVLAFDKTKLGNCADGVSVSAVLDFDDNEIRYHINGSLAPDYVVTGVNALVEDGEGGYSRYNFEGKQNFRYLWQLAVNNYESGTQLDLDYVKVAANDIYAVEHDKFASINYELDGGKLDGVHPIYYEIGKTLALSESVSKDGYVFAGWYTDFAFTNAITEIPATQTEPITLYAKWTKISGAISYDLNDGEAGEELPDRFVYGNALTLPTSVSKYGYEFAGWYLNADFSGSPITEISAEQRGDITLYAKWRSAFRVVTLITNGGTVEGGNGIVREDGKDVILPTEVIKENADFAGWYLDPQYTQKIEVIPSNMEGDDGSVTVYAKYIDYAERKDTVKLSGTNVGGKEFINYAEHIESNIEKALTVRIKMTDIDDDSYIYAKYYMRVRTAGAGANDNTVCVFYFENGEVLALDKTKLGSCADGVAVDAVLDFDDNEIRYHVGGSTTPTYVVTDVTKLLEDANGGYSKYDFSTVTSFKYLWQLAVSGAHTAGSTLELDYVNVAIKDIYSAESDKYAAIKYELNGGIADEDLPKSFEIGKGITLPDTVSKVGSTFAGWYLNADFSGSPVTEIPMDQYGSVTLYAKWSKAYGVITYEFNGGETEDEYETENKIGVAVILPVNVKRGLDTFVGWYLDPDFTGDPITEIDANNVNDITVYACFKSDFVEQHLNKLLTDKTANGVGGTQFIQYGDLIDATEEKCVTITIKATEITDENWIYQNYKMRVRTNSGSNQINLFQFGDGQIMALDGTILAQQKDGNTVDAVMDFDDAAIRYYVDGDLKHTATGVTKLAEDENGTHTNYNFSSSTTPKVIWQFFTNEVTMIEGGKLSFDYVCVRVLDPYKA